MTIREAELATVTLPAQSAAPQPGDTGRAPEADRFAAHLLMPEGLIQQQWKVSFRQSCVKSSN